MRMHGTLARAGLTAALTLSAGLAIGGAGGCSLRRPVALDLTEPAEAWSPRTAVDIRNFHGSVRVIVDPRVKKAETTAVAGAKPKFDEMADSKATESVSVVTDWVEQEGGRVLRIRTGATWPNPDEVWIDLTITMPSCGGATIWNRGGWVELIGVEGALQVDNGAMGSSDGTIRVRTAKAMTSPVTLTTDRGSVVYQVAGNSTGAFDLQADHGDAVYTSPINAPGHIEIWPNRTTATLNRGTNPILLRTGNGLVRAYVMDNPEAYTNKWE